jgi:hypothetical protein
MGKASCAYSAPWRAAIAALAIATSVRAELSVNYTTLSTALQTAFASAGGCRNQQIQDSQTSTQSDGTEVTYQFTSYLTSCEESGRRAASLKLVQMEGSDGMSGNLDVSFSNNWDLYLDFAASICTLETASGESCNCELCEATTSDSRKLAGATGSCVTPPSTDFPFIAGTCVGVSDLASGVAGTSGGSVNAGDKFGVSFDSLSGDLKSAFAGSCVSSTNALNCSSSNGRNGHLSSSNGELDELMLNQPGQFSLTIDFAASTCNAIRSGSSCGDCALCKDSRANLGVLSKCGSSDSAISSNITFSGVCNSIVDLAFDGRPSLTAYDIVANDLISAFTASNCDSSRMQVASNRSSGNSTMYQVSCSGTGNAAIVTSLDNAIQTLSVSAGNTWYLSVDYPMYTCQVEAQDSNKDASATTSCSTCELCRTTDGGYGVVASGCPTGPVADAFSSTECIGYETLAKSSGEYVEDQSNTFEDISSDIQSVFSADTCAEQPGYLNCSHPDGRSAYLEGYPNPDASGSFVPSALHVYNTGMYVVHVDFNTSDCSVELVNGLCDCAYCADEEGELGIMSRCGESQTDYFRLKTGECVPISDICDGRVNEGDEMAEKTMPTPPFYLVVSDLEEAFPEESCVKTIDNDSYKVQLPNGTNVYKTRRYLQMNCSHDGRTAFVNKTDDAGVEIMGQLNIWSPEDPSATVSFDFEAETCYVTADGGACSNCTVCKYNDDKKYGVSAYCPDAMSSSPFSGDGTACVSIVELAGGELVSSPSSNGTSTGNGTTPSNGSNATDTDENDEEGEADDVWAEDPNNPGPGESTDDGSEGDEGTGSDGEGSGDDAPNDGDDAPILTDDGAETGSDETDGDSTSSGTSSGNVPRFVAIAMLMAVALL